MRVIFLLVLLILLILFRYYYFFQTQKHYRDEETIRFNAVLANEPEQRGRVQSFSLRPQGYEELYVNAPLFPEYHYGQRLAVRGKVTLQEGEKKTFASMTYPKIIELENDSLLYRLT